MLSRFWVAVLVFGCGLLAAVHVARTQDASDAYFDAIDHPAIAYRTTTPTDPVARLAGQLASGTARLAYDEATGYLPALLHALNIPVASQLAVFSKTSLQQHLISPQNPRVIYFTDTTMVAWPRDGFIEIASEDPRQGVMFYMLPQQRMEQPLILRRTDCLLCHHSYSTLGVPGLLTRSVITGPHGEAMPFLGNYVIDDRSPLEERWAGWFVTGSSGSGRHLGNLTPPVTRDLDATVTPQASTVSAFAEPLTGYLSPQSDIVAHLVFDHQTRMINLLTRTGWLVRLAEAENRAVAATTERVARELVDGLLYIDHARLPTGIVGSPDFAAAFAARGPTDASGRSLRTFDLQTRLMRYPCSYLIYSEAFDALPARALDAVYRRLWAVLSGNESDARYATLSASDRRAIIEILRDTKKGLPEYFK